jgi:hypothetical protein
MAHEFPAQDIVTAQASTSQVIAKDLPCQLDRALVLELERERLLFKNDSVKHCTVDPRLPLSPAQARVCAAARGHVLHSSPANSTIEDRYVLAGITAIVSASSLSRFTAQMTAVSGRGHPDMGWAWDGIFGRTWDRLVFDRFGPHDRIAQSHDDIEWRRRVLAQLEAHPSVQHPRCPWARVYTVFHACRDGATALSICRTGFTMLARLDPGYYSQGLYFTLDLDYALAQYGMNMLDPNGCATILVCDAVVGNVYPAIEHPHDASRRSLKGRPQVSPACPRCAGGADRTDTGKGRGRSGKDRPGHAVARWGSVLKCRPVPDRSRARRSTPLTFAVRVAQHPAQAAAAAAWVHHLPQPDRDSAFQLGCRSGSAAQALLRLLALIRCGPTLPDFPHSCAVQPVSVPSLTFTQTINPKPCLALPEHAHLVP